MFDDLSLNAVVQKTLADNHMSIPPDAHGAFVTVVTEHGIKAVVTARVRGTWQISGVIEHDWNTKDLVCGATLSGTF